ncbi:MAG: hypothetical protein U9Q81_03695 [Pseudomonadota bacterium]|nr:hypothetical protein [Pseudomonadota bacterium]
MDLETLNDTPPWDWPQETAKRLLEILRNRRGSQEERKLAAELAGDFTVFDDEIGSALLAVIRDSDETEDLRSTAAIALGPAMEHAHTFEFEDPDDLLLSEKVFRDVQQSLRQLYLDATVPKDVRRSILEAAVRAPQDWSRDAIRAAYASPDETWRLTAVFGMRFVPGFKDQILEALSSKNQDISYQALCAAGNWQIDAAWPHIETILGADPLDKPLLIAAIEAAASVRPQAAAELLTKFTNSEDEDIADAAFEALAMAAGLSELEDDDDEDEDELWR